jgi:glutamyl-tRNA synthetase
MSKKIRVRFAPSPTGPLHIGGLRTALFNYLYAKSFGGDFILRIEDTDKKRYVSESEQHILDSLKWCGLTIDEGPENEGNYGPYRQSERKELYDLKIQELLKGGHAYYAFDKKEELDFYRKNHEQEGKIFIYNAHNRLKLKNSLSLDNKEVQQMLDENQEFVIRFKTPEKTEIVCEDLLRGTVRVSSETLDDKVLYKSDGMPTYHFANVVDDNAMKISHVIRGEEWLPSLPLHWLLYDAFGWKERPEFIHLPLILKPTGKGKLSKRDGELMGFPVFPIKWRSDKGEVIGYKEIGYLPGATINFLSLLGWNPGNEKEIFSLSELVSLFSVKGLNSSGSRFDPEKNLWFNHQHLQLTSDRDLAKCLGKELVKKGIDSKEKDLTKITALIKPRLNLLSDLVDVSLFFFKDPKVYNEKALRKFNNEENLLLLGSLSAFFKTIHPFNAQEIKKSLEAYISENNWSFGKALGLLRLAMVGELSGPDLFSLLQELGKETSEKRANSLINVLKP